MKLAGFLVCVVLIGLGFHFFRLCSNRFMMLRHAKSYTPYWWGIGGIVSLLMITLAVFAGLFLILSRLR